MTPAGVLRSGAVSARAQRVPRAAVRAGLLPTPATRDHHAQGAGHNTKARSSSLATVIQKKALLPTPMAADSNRQSRTFMRGNPTLLGAAELWPTPRANKPGGFSSPGFSQTLEQAVLQIPRGQRAGIKGNTLNPDWVTWLMGFPTGWLT